MANLVLGGDGTWNGVDLNINSGKFTVDSATGNTVVGGTLISGGPILNVSGSQNALLGIYDGTTMQINSYSGTTPLAIRFAGYTTEYMRIDASGNLGLGVTPSAWSSTQKALDIGAGAGIRGDSLTLGINQNCYYNQAGNWIYKQSASPSSRYEASVGTHTWYTAASGTAGNAITWTTAMTLDASGKLTLSSTSIGNILSVQGAGNGVTAATIQNNGNSTPYGQSIVFPFAAPNNTTQYFLQAIDSSVSCFTIWSNGTTSGRSDERLKKNISLVNSQLADVLAMEVVNYEWIESVGGTKEVGFIAQQVQAIKPGLVQEDDKGYLHIKQTPLVPILWKAVQELATRIAALEGAAK